MNEVKKNIAEVNLRRKIPKFVGIALAIILSGILLTFLISLTGKPRIFWKHPQITASEIPLYPNADSVVEDGTEDPVFEQHTWYFSSTDSPEEVWGFYVDNLKSMWGFVDETVPQFEDKNLILHSCPFYSLNMTSKTSDNINYDYAIHFSKVPCQ